MAIVINGSGTVTGISVGGLPDDIVDAGTLADNAVGLAQMAGGTDGNIITYDTSGNPAVVATGSDGQVLTSAGADAVPAFEAAASGKIKQIVNTQTGAGATGTTTMPANDTIPQITEGDEYMTLAITPTSATSKLQITATTMTNVSNSNQISAALFVGTTADALASMNVNYPHSGHYGANVATFSHTMTAGTTSELTFRVRIGGNDAGTIYFNGYNAARIFGGTAASSITITEYEV
jgi:hypothetical protein